MESDIIKLKEENKALKQALDSIWNMMEDRKKMFSCDFLVHVVAEIAEKALKKQ